MHWIPSSVTSDTDSSQVHRESVPQGSLVTTGMIYIFKVYTCGFLGLAQMV